MSPDESQRRKEAVVGAGARQTGFDRITAVMNSIGTAWVFVLLILINLGIGGRAIFNHPIRGVPEIVALSSVTFGGPDLRTVYIGNLRVTRIPYFRSPVAGLPMVHWK